VLGVGGPESVPGLAGFLDNAIWYPQVLDCTQMGVLVVLSCANAALLHARDLTSLPAVRLVGAC
jgi:hypothetical protein